MPVWYEKSKEWVRDGRLSIIGVAQEQHPERCRLWLQWQQIPWQMLHDPITRTGLTAVPVLTAIDEAGVVRLTRPNPETFEQEFLNRDFAASPSVPTNPVLPPNRALLRATAEKNGQPDDWLAYADAVTLWGARIQQYGPRLDKPYPFYDWVETARAEIRSRGENPILLRAEPVGAEVATPLKSLTAASPVKEPDPERKIALDGGEFVRIEAVTAPRRVQPGEPLRLHLVFRVNSERKAHWNNEAEPLRVWLSIPEGWEAEKRLLEVPLPPQPTSDEVRELSVELRVGRGAQPGSVSVRGYALYNVCEDRDGVCLYRRQDFSRLVQIRAEPGSGQHR
ncbi:MAG: hypothetical protein OHK0029_23740 [Armatimonadaceae bacterium]